MVIAAVIFPGACGRSRSEIYWEPTKFDCLSGRLYKDARGVEETHVAVMDDHVHFPCSWIREVEQIDGIAYVELAQPGMAEPNV